MPGTGRRVFTVDGLTFGIAICHEAFRYPEITRSLALAGAQVVFVPHFVTTADGSLPTGWCDASNPYNEKALMVRALENSIYIAQSNVAGPDQGSITGIVGPDGSLVASLPYGERRRRRGRHRSRTSRPGSWRGAGRRSGTSSPERQARMRRLAISPSIWRSAST